MQTAQARWPLHHRQPALDQSDGNESCTEKVKSID